MYVLYIFLKLVGISEWGVTIVRSHPCWYNADPSFVHQPHMEKENQKYHKDISLHCTDNTIQYLHSPVIPYHGVVCQNGFEGMSRIHFYTGTWNKYCLLQDSFRKIIMSVLTSHSSTHQVFVLPDHFSFISKMKALSRAIFPVSEIPVINP